MAAIDIKTEKTDGENALPPEYAAINDPTIKLDAAPGGGLPVSFTNLEYTVKVKKEPKKILDGLSGCFQPGRLTALMGPSGSGKTTLMDLLAGRKTGAGVSTGEVLYGGSVVPSDALKQLCGYVEQFDTLVGELTVSQMLMYTAELKLPLSMSRKEKADRCEEVIKMLRLDTCRDTVIGNPLQRGISGGQAKRVNIALALITQPKVVFLDEPTSGLDSNMANEVCLLLKEMAKKGCTVVATIHAPTSFAFSLFDDLVMLQAGGRLIYTGTVPQVRPYLEGEGFKFPVGYSLPEWLVDITSGGTGDSASGAAVAAEQKNFAEVWLASDLGKSAAKQHPEVVASQKASPSQVRATPGPGQLHALRTLVGYRMTTHYRSGEFLGPRFGDKIFMAILMSTLYWDVGSGRDARSIQSTAALLYFVSALCGYGAAAFVPSLTLERPLFYRERADGCYLALTYYLSKFIEEAVLCTLTSLVFSAIIFWSLGLKGNFFVFVFSYYLTTMMGIVLAYAIAAIAPNMEAANALLPTYVTTCMYFGGLFLMFDKIPSGWKWYSWTSFLRYSWGALMLNNFNGEELGSAPLFFSEDGVSINVLEFYGLDDGLMNSVGGCLGILAGLIFFWCFLGVVFITFVSHLKR
eukprot:gnl/TRDRNA2_/TRDRNA2_38445_c0_seq1.p1 gnl/TRDRNA2_/TRDRNA2_38445_c0~~gnl/TRDRNA2_/TRDRNA2_38445_c0_seq1.p1  ORF type:complete len:634 (+),score=111.22 gnl/TRDRNA2_/TRDRNA2_38445_c0_seq1:94-1995(+)